jgi:hypothetical protein
MARLVAELPDPGRDGKSKYPWDQWLDGRVWLLEKGEDFRISVPSMQSSVTNAARARGLKVKMRARPEGLYIQCLQPEE